MVRAFIYAFILLLFSSLSFANCKQDELTQDNPDFQCEGQLAPSVYYTPIINLDKDTLDASPLPQCDEDLKKPVLNTEGEPIVTLCNNKYVYESFVSQGAFRIDQKVDGVDKKTMYTHIDNERFMPIKAEMHNRCPYGLGHIPSICLDPFYSVAADIKKFPAGTVIYLPDVKGAHLPNGKKHLGFFIVRDIGGDIKNMRFDFFTSFNPWQSKSNAFTEYGVNKLKLSDPKVPYDFYIVKGATAEEFLKERQYPGLPNKKTSK